MSLMKPHGPVSGGHCTSDQQQTSSFDLVTHSLCFYCAVLKIKNISSEVSLLSVHTIQLVPERAFNERETYSTVSLQPQGERELVLPTLVKYKLCCCCFDIVVCYYF